MIDLPIVILGVTILAIVELAAPYLAGFAIRSINKMVK